MRIAVALLLWSLGNACAAQALSDFAYALELKTAAPSPFYSVTLPRPVYEGVVRGDLGDLRVFNAAGEVVPHAWRPRDATVQTPAVGAPLFALHGRAGAGADRSSVKIETRGDGTIVSVAPAPKTAPGDGEVQGYLVDVSAIKVAVRAVEIEPPPGAATFAAKLTVEASDDLAQWRVLVRESPVLSLTSPAGHLKRLRIEFPAQKLKYLRLSWPAGSPPIDIAVVKVAPGEARAEAQREWKALSATPRKDHEFVFEPGGRFPTDRLRMRLPQPNTVAQVEVLYRAPGTIESWLPLARGVAYRLQSGDGEVTSPDTELAATPRDALLLRVDPKSGGIGEGKLGLEIGWIPHELVFAARSAGPFRLAYGSAQAEAAAYRIETLIPGYEQRRDVSKPAALDILPARAGEPVTVAGPAALRKPVDARRWMLWSALVAGVLLLGVMAWRLLREVGSPSPGTSAGGTAAAANTDPDRG